MAKTRVVGLEAYQTTMVRRELAISQFGRGKLSNYFHTRSSIGVPMVEWDILAHCYYEPGILLHIRYFLPSKLQPQYFVEHTGI